MTHPHDNIRVGAITFVYSVTKRGWVFPGLSVIRNPLKAQRRCSVPNSRKETLSSVFFRFGPDTHGRRAACIYVDTIEWCKTFRGMA